MIADLSLLIKITYQINQLISFLSLSILLKEKILVSLLTMKNFNSKSKINLKSIFKMTPSKRNSSIHNKTKGPFKNYLLNLKAMNLINNKNISHSNNQFNKSRVYLMILIKNHIKIIPLIYNH